MSHAGRSASAFTWGIFLIVIAMSVLVVFGFEMAPIVLFGGLIALLFSYLYPYAAFGLMTVLVPCLGFYLHLPTGDLAFGRMAFGGSVDIPVVEAVGIVLLLAWGIKIFVLWLGRKDWNWKPWLPLLWPMLGIVAAHAFSMFSPFSPDVFFVLKYTVRPVLWSYLLYVVLTVNYVRSPRRLRVTLGLMAWMGVFAAIMGFVSLWYSPDLGAIFPRARPLSIFGVSLLGENHNLLAEWLCVSAMATLALAFLTRSLRLRRLLYSALAFQAVIALLTFSRTLWIVFTFEVLALGWFVWRDRVRHLVPYAAIGACLLVPIAALMFMFSSTALVQGSTSSRLMLTEIALNTWWQSPIVGAGAGTFADRVGNTSVFLIEYGSALDSHGWIQKLLAETGILGLLSVVVFFVVGFRLFLTVLRRDFSGHSAARSALIVLAIGVGGALISQLFNTNYWSGKMWFPIGLLFAAMRALADRPEERKNDPFV